MPDKSAEQVRCPEEGTTGMFSYKLDSFTFAALLVNYWSVHAVCVENSYAVSRMEVKPAINALIQIWWQVKKVDPDNKWQDSAFAERTMNLSL